MLLLDGVPDAFLLSSSFKSATNKEAECELSDGANDSPAQSARWSHEVMTSRHVVVATESLPVPKHESFLCDLCRGNNWLFSKTSEYGGSVTTFPMSFVL